MFVTLIVGSAVFVNSGRALIGITFSIGLVFVIFAGAELFTGNVLPMFVALFAKRVSFGAMSAVLGISLIGNLIGAFITAGAVYGTGLIKSMNLSMFIGSMSQAKMNLPLGEMVWRAVLCNMFVTMAVWMCFRAKSDAAKIVSIIACIFAFVVAGFEHSIANAFLLPIAVILEITGEYHVLGVHGVHTLGIGIGGLLYNITFVLIGNLAGGILIAAAYWFPNRIRKGNNDV
jgi:nitrite transporter NirC